MRTNADCIRECIPFFSEKVKIFEFYKSFCCFLEMSWFLFYSIVVSHSPLRNVKPVSSSHVDVFLKSLLQIFFSFRSKMRFFLFVFIFALLLRCVLCEATVCWLFFFWNLEINFKFLSFQSIFKFCKVFFNYTLDKFLPFVLHSPLGNSINLGLLLHVLLSITLSSLELSFLLFSFAVCIRSQSLFSVPLICSWNINSITQDSNDSLFYRGIGPELFLSHTVAAIPSSLEID